MVGSLLSLWSVRAHIQRAWWVSGAFGLALTHVGTTRPRSALEAMRSADRSAFWAAVMGTFVACQGDPEPSDPSARMARAWGGHDPDHHRMYLTTSKRRSNEKGRLQEIVDVAQHADGHAGHPRRSRPSQPPTESHSRSPLWGSGATSAVPSTHSRTAVLAMWVDGRVVDPTSPQHPPPRPLSGSLDACPAGRLRPDAVERGGACAVRIDVWNVSHEYREHGVSWSHE